MRRLSWQASRSCRVRRLRARFSAVRRRSVAFFHKVVQSLLAVSWPRTDRPPDKPIPATWQLANKSDISLSTRATKTSKASETRSAYSRASLRTVQFDSYLPKQNQIVSNRWFFPKFLSSSIQFDYRELRSWFFFESLNHHEIRSRQKKNKNKKVKDDEYSPRTTASLSPRARDSANVSAKTSFWARKCSERLAKRSTSNSSSFTRIDSAPETLCASPRTESWWKNETNCSATRGSWILSKNK